VDVIKIVLLVLAVLAAYKLAKIAVKSIVKSIIMRKRMTVTVKLNGAIIVQQTMRLGTMINEKKLFEVLGRAIDDSPLAGATMVGEPKEEKVGVLGRRLTVLVRKGYSDAQFTLEMLPAVI
jgi:hypothetical protein